MLSPAFHETIVKIMVTILIEVNLHLALIAALHTPE
jgi:hypothetical protein